MNSIRKAGPTQANSPAYTTRSIFLENTDKEWYLSLESDVILNKEAVDLIVSNVQNKFAFVLHTNCYSGFNNAKERGNTDRLTMGCTLIHRSVLSEIEFRFDESLPQAHYDAFFAHDCISKNIPMVYDPSIVLEHCHDEKGSRGWCEIPKIERRIK